MTFGTAESVDDVPSYLSRVRGGAPVPGKMAAEFQRRFARIGGSPLVHITKEQAAALEGSLNRGPAYRGGFRVAVGMRFSAPTIPDGLRTLRDWGAQRILGIVLSPQYSAVVLGGYLRDLSAAQETIAPDADVRVAGAWHDEPLFIDALTSRLEEATTTFQEQDGMPQILFTAHSLPCRVAEQDPDYLEQLRATAVAVAGRAGLGANQWRFAYQSAGHTGDEWLRPDVQDVLPDLCSAGVGRVLIAPVQFLADHLEVLYDIDVAARDDAASVGIDLRRVESLNTMPQFIDALAAVVRRELDRWDA